MIRKILNNDDWIKLKLTHKGTDRFPKDYPGLVRDNFIGSWKVLIHESLKDYLENGKKLKI